MSKLSWRRNAPGSYWAPVMPGVEIRLYTDCQCGSCDPWVVDVYEDGFRVDQTTGFPRLRVAKDYADELAARRLLLSTEA